MKAAIEGRVIILDGVDRLIPSTFSILQRLSQDREFTLFDGTTLVKYEKFKLFQENMTEVQLQKKKIIAIHPSFRMIAIGILPSPSNQWITSEVISMFHFHVMRPLSVDEKCSLIFTQFPKLKNIQKWIVQFLTLKDQNTKTEQLHPLINKEDRCIFSIREIFRICKKLESFSHFDQLPDLSSLNFIQNVNKSYQIIQFITKEMTKDSSNDQNLSISIVDINNKKHVKIGEVECPVETPSDPALIPQVKFFDITNHVLILREMLRDYMIGGKYFLQLFFTLKHFF